MSLRRTHLVLALVAALAAPATASAAATFTISGHGYGHGVGMGQYGAQGYALQGWTPPADPGALLPGHHARAFGRFAGARAAAGEATRLRPRARRMASPPPTRAAPRSSRRGAAAVRCARIAAGFSLVDASGTVLASGWVGPGLADRHRRRPHHARRRGAELRVGRPLSRATARARRRRRVSGRESRHARELPARRGRERDALDWEPEALETQAIAARTYAVATRKPATSPFDLYPDERSQVYRGLAAERPRRRRLRSTRPAGQVVLYQGQPIVDLLLVVHGRAHRSGPGVAPGRRSRAVPGLRRRSLRHDLALPRLDALAERPRPLAEGRLPGPRHRRAGRTPTRPAASTRSRFNGSAGPARALGVARAQAPRAALDLVHGRRRARPRRRSTCQIDLHSRVVRDRVLLTGNAPPGAVTLQAAAASSGWRDIATHPVADDGAVSFRRPVGEAARYRLVAGSLSSAGRARDPPLGACSCGRAGRAAARPALSRAGARGFVALQHVIGGRWTWVARAKTRADGTFRFLVRADGGRWRVRWRGAGSFLGALSPELRVGRRTLAWTPTDPLAAREWNLTAVNAFGYADTLPVLQDAPVDGGGDRQRHRSHEPRPRGRRSAGADRRGARSVRLAASTAPPWRASSRPTPTTASAASASALPTSSCSTTAWSAAATSTRRRGRGDPRRGRRRRPRDQPLAGRQPRPEGPGAGRVLARRARRDLLRRQAAGRWSSPRSATRVGHAGIYASWPAALRHVIGVSAVDPRSPGLRSRTPTRSSTTSPRPASASSRPCRARSRRRGRRSTPRPGMTIQPDGTVMGTSFAAPHVSAAAAVLLARHPEFTPTQVMWILEHTARRLGDTAGIGRDRLTGFGLLDVTAAVKLADGPAGRPAAGRTPTSPTTSPRTRRRCASPSGSIDAVADFGDDRRDVYKVYLHAGRDARVRTEAPAALGGNLGLDVDDLPARHHESRAARPSGRSRADAPDRVEQLAARSATRPYGRLLPRAGLRAARLGRLPPALERQPGPAVGSSRRRAAPRAATSRRTRAGWPTTTVRAGTSRSTIAPAPTKASSPISTPGSRIAAPPTRAPRRIDRALHERAPLLGASHEVVVRGDDAGRDEDVVLELAVGGHVGLGLDAHARADASCRSRPSRRARPRCRCRSSRARAPRRGRRRSRRRPAPCRRTRWRRSRSCSSHRS